MEAYEQQHAVHVAEDGSAGDEDATNDSQGAYLQSAPPTDPGTSHLELLSSAAMSGQAVACLAHQTGAWHSGLEAGTALQVRYAFQPGMPDMLRRGTTLEQCFCESHMSSLVLHCLGCLMGGRLASAWKQLFGATFLGIHQQSCNHRKVLSHGLI